MSVTSSTIPNAMKQHNSPTGQILYVGGTGPGNYSCINDAIDNTINGDIIFVYNGTYNETVIIDKSIVLQGENKHSTIINGLRKNDTVTITTSRVTVAGFTITNSSYDMKAGLWWKAGVRILDSHNIIRDNIISNNRLGIFSKQASNLIIMNNTFENDGITLYPYDTDYQTRPTLSKKHFVHTIDNNTVNGNPLLYYVDKSDFEVPSKVGQLIAVNCTNMTVKTYQYIMLILWASWCFVLIALSKIQGLQRAMEHLLCWHQITILLETTLCIIIFMDSF
jgi:parallel beta-helix repeat protein